MPVKRNFMVCTAFGFSENSHCYFMTEFSSLELFLLYNQSMERSIAKFFDQPTFLRIKKTWEMFFVPMASGLGAEH